MYVLNSVHSFPFYNNHICRHTNNTNQPSFFSLFFFTIKTFSGASSDSFDLGAPSDYDEWAKSGLEGAEAWRFDEFQK